MTDYMPFLDVETFGLIHKSDPIIEIGLHLVNNDFEVVHKFESTVWDPTVSDGRLRLLEDDAKYDDNAAWLLKLHTDNRLFEDAQADERTFSQVQRDLVEFIYDHDIVNEPIYGSSVHFDRESIRTWMRSLHDAFHYRNVDISTLKTLCARFTPTMYAGMAVDIPHTTDHRVKNCLKGTVAEAKWYADNFLFIPGNKRDFPVPEVG